MGEFGGEQRLADPADDAGFQHRADALEHGVQRHAGLLGDPVERLALEAGDEILGNRENPGVDRVVVFDGDGGGSWRMIIMVKWMMNSNSGENGVLGKSGLRTEWDLANREI